MPQRGLTVVALTIVALPSLHRMKNRRYAIYAVVLVILAALVYVQFRTWRNFDWAQLFRYHPLWRHIVHAIAYIYIAYLLRAVRWKIFLRPVRKNASILGLIPPTVIGFTGLALLGRPGELIRPYLIARQENLSVASQFAVWAVERIFDIGAFTVILVAAIFVPYTKLHIFIETASPGIQSWVHRTGYALIALVFGLFVATLLMSWRGNRTARWVEERFSHLSQNLGHRIAHKIREFTEGLNTIHGPIAFLQLATVSVLMWWVIALSYKEVTTAYGAPMHTMSTTKDLLLMGSSMVGSMVQLPGVGGGSQLAIISVMDHVFDVPKELAVSCGIMLWLVSFVAVIPVGLLLAHHERLSLRKLSAESAEAENN